MVTEEATTDSTTQQNSDVATTEADWFPLDVCFEIPVQF